MSITIKKWDAVFSLVDILNAHLKQQKKL